MHGQQQHEKKKLTIWNRIISNCVSVACAAYDYMIWCARWVHTRNLCLKAATKYMLHRRKCVATKAKTKKEPIIICKNIRHPPPENNLLRRAKQLSHEVHPCVVAGDTTLGFSTLAHLCASRPTDRPNILPHYAIPSENALVELISQSIFFYTRYVENFNTKWIYGVNLLKGLSLKYLLNNSIFHAYRDHVYLWIFLN